MGGLREAWPRLRGQWPLLMGISALGVGCYNSLQYLALQTSTAVNATLIGASGPILTLLVGAAFFGSPVRRPQWIGAALSMVGVLIVIARGDLMKLATLQLDRGDLIMLVATLTWSVYTWLLRNRRPNLPATRSDAADGARCADDPAFAVLEFFWTGKRWLGLGATLARWSMSPCCPHLSPISAGTEEWPAQERCCRCTSSI